MVGTAMPPALITARIAAASIGLLAARRRTRLPGCKPMSRTSTLAIRFTRSRSAGVGKRSTGDTTQGRLPKPWSTMRSSSSTQRIQAFRIAQFGQIEAERRLQELRRQVVPREGVGMCARCHPFLLSGCPATPRPSAASKSLSRSQHLTCDDHLLNFGRSLVDAKRTDLAIELLDLGADADTVAAVQLHGTIDHVLGDLGRIHLRDRCLARDAGGAAVLDPGRAIDEKRGRVDFGLAVGE